MTDSSTTAGSAVEPKAQSSGVNVALWVLQALLALAFLAQAGFKYGGAEMAVDTFDQIGAGDWLRYLVGSLELAGALGLLIPRLSGLAALGLVGLMVGAITTHLTLIGGSFAPALSLLVLAAVVVWGRRGTIAALVGKG